MYRANSTAGKSFYVLQRRDRPTRGGGVCTFVSSSITFKRRSDLESPDHECMWLWLRPPRRPFSGIIVGAMYFPDAPADAQRARASYIIERIDSVKSAHPDCGVILLGDFNTLDVTNILTNHTLKQLVREPTRGNSVLDLVISNLASYYNKPVVSAHLGSSDHCSVHWVPNPNYGSSKLTAKKKVVKMRRFPESALNEFGRWVSAHNWFAHSCAVDYLPVDSLTTSFSDDLCNAINIYVPAKSVKIHPTDKPWMSAEIKSLILERQRACHSGSNERWRLLRNKVRMAICKRKKEFFARKVKSLKTSDPRSWWSLVSKLAGKSSTHSELSYPDEHGNIISGKTLATRLNSYFISVTSDIQPLDTAALPAYLPSPDRPPTIATSAVCRKLLGLSAYKA